LNPTVEFIFIVKKGALTMKFNPLKNTLLAASVAAISLFTLSACEVTTVQSGGGYDGGGGSSDPYQHAWYDVYGTQCTSYGYPMSGCNFYADGSKIMASEDPYYSSMTLYYDYWSYTDSYGYRQGYEGYAWLSSTGILYDEYGNALNEMDQDQAQSADVISQAAQKEEQMAQKVGKAFAQKYALAEDAGVSIAKTLQDWAVLGKDRARTESDVADFSQRLYGVSLDQAKSALVNALKGNKDSLDELNVDVAAHWGTSPETSKAILSQWYQDEMSQLGVK